MSLETPSGWYQRVRRGKGGLGRFNEGSKKGGDVSIADASRGIHVARCS